VTFVIRLPRHSLGEGGPFVIRTFLHPSAFRPTRFVRGEIGCFGKDLPMPLRKALRRAIHASTILTDELKALVAHP
jgi:hypothetical protein